MLSLLASQAPGGLTAGDDLLEPQRLNERKVLHEPGQVGARIDRAAASVLAAEPSELLEDARPQPVERLAKLFHLGGHAASVTMSSPS
jgi:hypothetical protein